MTRLAPFPQLILTYQEFFGIAPPKNRISLIKEISKESILYEIVALNYRLKPKRQIHIDTSFETQVKELKYFTKTGELFSIYAQTVLEYTGKRFKANYPIIFNRQACLFAIEEIVNSDEMQIIEGFEMSKAEVWDAILKYLLAVNYKITEIGMEKDISVSLFEEINSKTLPLNELAVEIDHIYTSYRGYMLIEYFQNNSKFSSELRQYFQETYGLEPYSFIHLVMKLYLSNCCEDPELNFFYLIKDGNQSFFDKLSIRFKNEETYKLISIRKSPFIKLGDLQYLITDNSFLIEKVYSQFINDFWFDRIKYIKKRNGKQKFTIDYYRSVIGYFFEKYIAQILMKSFEKYKYSKLLMFDKLKIYSGKRQIEIADIYLRYGNKILLGQVKSGSIYDNEKYGGNIERLYNNDRNKFFEKFGVNQIINSLSEMDNNMLALDPKFPKNHFYKVYPCIIVNDKAFQTPLMPNVFNLRFQELLKVSNHKKIFVNPLTIIHISDIEMLEESLIKNPSEIWKILEYNYRDKSFILPFYNAVNQKVQRNQYPKKIAKLYENLTSEYG